MKKDQAVVRTRAPGACRKADRTAFEALVVRGGEVDPVRLTDRIAAAKMLAFAHAGEELVGVGGLKRPNLGYHRKVFSKSDSALSATDFPLEIGWVYVVPAYRRKRIARRIVEALLDAAGNRRVFSTSRTENRSMHGLLEQFGFVRDGKPYLSDDESYELQLFVR